MIVVYGGDRLWWRPVGNKIENKRIRILNCCLFALLLSIISGLNWDGIHRLRYDIAFFLVPIASMLDNFQAPLFLQEPLSRLIFNNDSGSQISCSAHGNPVPKVWWVQKDGSPVISVPGLR